MADVERLRSSSDPMVWAEEFCSTFGIYTEKYGTVDDGPGLMVGWFANAMGVARQSWSLADHMRALGWSDEKIGAAMDAAGAVGG